MKIFLLVLGIIVLLALFIIFLPLRVVFEYKGKSKLKIFVFKIKVYDSQKAKKGNGETEKDDGNDLESALKDLKKNFNFLKEFLKLLIEKAKKYVIIKNIEVKYHFGLSDAALTGIYSGAVYGVVNGFAMFLRNYFKICKQKLEIKPDFDNQVQEFETKVELKIRLVFFAAVLLKLANLINEEEEV